jgi:hypothetical protein
MSKENLELEQLLAENQRVQAIIPASPGYFMLVADRNGQEFCFYKVPIIAWEIYTHRRRPITIGAVETWLNDESGGFAVLIPDGTVHGDDCGDGPVAYSDLHAWAMVEREEWATRREIEAAAEAAKAAKADEASAESAAERDSGQVGVFAKANFNGVDWPKGLKLEVAKAAEPLDGQIKRVKGPKSGGAKPSTQRGSPALELIDDSNGAETRPA